jgi:hypothetical protein
MHISRHGATVLYVSLSLAFVLSIPHRPVGDEYIHWLHAVNFSRGNYALSPWLSTWPTMNFVMSFVIRALGVEQLILGRLVNWMFSVVAFAGLLRLCRNAESGTTGQVASLRALQFALSPVTLFVSALVYTDMPALASLIWAAVGVVERKRALILFAGGATIAFRQSHILWFGALILWFLAQEAQRYKAALPSERLWATIRDTLHSQRAVIVGAAAVCLLWAIIVWTTGGVAAGQETQVGHRLSLRGAPNVFFSMVVWVICFLPLAIALLMHANADDARMATPKRLLLLSFAFASAVLFVATCPSNTDPSVQQFIRNRILRHLQSPVGHSVLVVTSIVGAYCWLRGRWIPTVAYMKTPTIAFAIGYLVPFWLIEQRYYLPMFMLFTVFRAAQPRRVEIAQVLWSCLLSAWFLHELIVKGRLL